MKFAITDDLLEKMLEAKSVIRINNKIYYATNNRDFVVGNMVLDKNDGAYGSIDMIDAKYAAVRDGCVVGIVKPDHLVRLLLADALN